MTEDKTPLRALRLKKGITQKDIAKLCDVSITTISTWERGIYDIDNRSLRILADYFGVTTDYLLGKKENVKPWIPVLGDVAAGIPITVMEDIGDEYEQIDGNAEEYFALRIKGNSMEPRMRSGDVVIVHRQNIVDNNEIAVVKVNADAATVKIVRIVENGVWLVPINPAFETTFYTVEQVRALPVSIIGKVVELRAKF